MVHQERIDRPVSLYATHIKHSPHFFIRNLSKFSNTGKLAEATNGVPISFDRVG